jgi:hypothetical protein
MESSVLVDGGSSRWDSESMFYLRGKIHRTIGNFPDRIQTRSFDTFRLEHPNNKP